jgi:hypothetical protein
MRFSTNPLRYRARAFALAALTAFCLLGLNPPAQAGVGFKAMRGYNSDKLQKWIDALIKTDYYPISISGYPVGGEPLFAVVAIDDGTNPEWEFHYNLSGTEYKQKLDELSGKGFRPTAIVGYQNGDESAFAGVWLKDKTRRKWFMVRNYNLEQIYKAIEEQKDKGMQPVFLAGYNLGSAQRFSAIFNVSKGSSWTSRYNMTGTELQKAYDELSPKGFRPITISGYQRGDATRFAAVFIKDPGAWQARHNLTATRLDEEFRKWTDKDYRPLSVSAYYVGDELRYAAIWVKE